MSGGEGGGGDAEKRRKKSRVLYKRRGKTRHERVTGDDTVGGRLYELRRWRYKKVEPRTTRTGGYPPLPTDDRDRTKNAETPRDPRHKRRFANMPENKREVKPPSKFVVKAQSHVTRTQR